jgi:hypothetical protein
VWGIKSRELENLANAMSRRVTAGSILEQLEEDLDMLKEMHRKG